MTVHGPVFGTVTVGGKPYAITRQRSTYGQDGLVDRRAARPDLRTRPDRHRLLRVGQRVRVHLQLRLREPRATPPTSPPACCRAARRGTNKLLPTLGTGRYDWRGFISLAQHPHDTGGPGGLFLNWNNKPAPGWQPGDDNHSYGSVHRVQMFNHVPAPRSHRGRRVQHEPRRDPGPAGHGGVARHPRRPARRARRRTRAPRRRPTAHHRLGSAAARSRIDANLDGKIDDPGAAVMDAAWNGSPTPC